jgi:dTMP kinase
MEQLSRLAADDRKQHLKSVILPSLRRGEWVLCDRYVYSSYAFFRARGVDLALVKHLNAGVRMPDLTVFLDLDPSEARQRVVAREGRISKYEERDLEFMAVVRQTFLDCRDESFLILDAGKPAVEIAADIARVVGRLVGVETQ